MRSGSEIKTYNNFNEYYSDANVTVRSRHDEFHVLRFSDPGDGIVQPLVITLGEEDYHVLIYVE